MTQPRRETGQFRPAPHPPLNFGAASTTPSPASSLPAGRPQPVPPTPGEWVRWHALELVGVGIPAVLAVWVSVWFALLALPAAAVWAAGERRAYRQQQSRLQGSGRPSITGDNEMTSGDEVS